MTLTFTKTALMAATCGLCFALSPALAFEPSTDAEKLLVSWLEEGSCALSQKDFMAKALSKPGVPPSDLMKARRAMTSSGVIRKGEGNSMTLTAGAACGDVKVAEPTYDSGSEEDVLVSKLVSLFEANECVLTERRARTLFEAEGLTRAQLDVAGEALEDDGAFKETDAGLQLVIGKCADFVAKAPQGDDETRVMAMFEQNGCSLTEDQLPDVAQQFQVTRKQFRAVTKPMKGTDALTEVDGKITLTVGEICGGAAPAKTATAPTEDTPEAASLVLIKLAEDNNCVLTEDLVEEFMGDKSSGFSPSSLDDAFDLLEDNGSIVIADDRKSARLVSGKTCEKAAQAAVAAYEPQTDDERTVITLFEENGCSLMEDELPALGSTYGLDKDAFRTAGRALMKSGMFAEKGDKITLLGGKCADGAQESSAETSLDAQIYGLFEAEGCKMTEDTFEAGAERLGLDDDVLGGRIEEMMAEGMISYDEATDQATLLSGDVCGKVSTTPAPAPSGDQRAEIIAIFEQNECRLTEQEARPLFAAIGIDIEDDDDIEIIGQMFADGDIIEGEDDEAILVTGDVCEKAEMSLKDTVIEAFAENDCTMTEDEFETAMADRDIDADEAGGLVEDMIESGDASYDRDTKQAKLLIGACAP